MANGASPAPKSSDTRGDRFAFDPPTEIAGPATRVAVDRPEVVRRRDRRVAQMREVPRLRREPPRVLRIGRRNECQRPPQRVDDLLGVSILARDTGRTPSPVRRQLPPGQVGGEVTGRLVETVHVLANSNTIVTRVPLPASLCTLIVPPHPSTTRRLTANPNPLPLVRVEKRGSNMRGNTFAGIPSPSSSTRITARPGPLRRGGAATAGVVTSDSPGTTRRRTPTRLAPASRAFSKHVQQYFARLIGPSRAPRPAH